jgi:hypothetical protein
MGGMDEREHGRGRALATATAVVVPLILILYVLSSGPVAWMLSRTRGGAEFWNAVYSPLLAADHYWPPAGRVHAAYLHWWMGDPMTLPNS